jgi:acetylornithine deacetylase/succinyl-diaminopimelate desuccinylase-like protein
MAAVLVLVAGAAIALVLYNRRQAEALRNPLYIPQQTKITAEIALLQRYVRFDTSNPPGEELPAAQWLAYELQKAGVQGEVIESGPGRASVYARIAGKHKGEGLLLLSHIDVVPAGAGWEVPPFSGAIRINQLHGRGAIDTKSLGICHLEAMRALVASGRIPERDVVFLAAADEETGGTLGVQWLLAHRPDVFEGIRYVLAEGGVTEMVKEQITYFAVEVGSKLNVDVDIEAASSDDLRKLRLALESSFTPPLPHRVLPEVRRFFHYIAPHRVEQGVLLADIDKAIADGKFWVLPSPYRELTQNNLWAESPRKEGSGFAMKVVMLNLPDTEPEERLRWLQQFAAPYGGTVNVVGEKIGPVPISSELTPLFARIAAEVHRQYGRIDVGTEVLAHSTSDARFLRPRGMTCYGLQPFPLDFFQSLSIHHPNERVRLDWFLQGVEMTRRIVTGYALDPAEQAVTGIVRTDTKEVSRTVPRRLP